LIKNAVSQSAARESYQTIWAKYWN